MPATMQNIHQDQVAKWLRYGHEPVYERGTVRLREFKKTLPADREVTVFDKKNERWVPLMLSCGRPLKCGEVLPERADLALDDEGRLLSQGEFEQRYMQYLSTFSYTEGSEIGLEPIPFVVNYVKETPDRFSESRGMIEIGFDPKLDQEFKPKQRWGPNGETEEEWLKESQKNSSDIASALQILAQNQAALQEFLMKQAGNVRVEVAPVVTDEPIGMSAEQAAEAVGNPTEETAPCGKRIKRGYLAQHQRFCNSEDCGGVGENTDPPEVA